MQVPGSSCIISLILKQHILVFKSSFLMRAKKGLSVVQSNIYGPQEVPSYSGSMYLIIFVDEFSMMLWIFFYQG